MTCRPVDASGDILPVLSSSALLSGAAAVSRLVSDRLSLNAGDWWENPSWGNRALAMLSSSRLTGEDLQALSNYLSSYIRETDGVQQIQDAVSSREGSRFSFTCTVDTAGGPAAVEFSA